MKWINRFLPSAIFAFLILSNTAIAEARELCPPGFTALCKMKMENSGSMIGNIITVILIIAIFTSLIFLIFGAFKWTTSGGDKGKVEGARATLIGAIVGLIVSLLAFFIVNTVLFVFTGKGLSGLTIPKL